MFQAKSRIQMPFEEHVWITEGETLRDMNWRRVVLHQVDQFFVDIPMLHFGLNVLDASGCWNATVTYFDQPFEFEYSISIYNSP